MHPPNEGAHSRGIGGSSLVFVPNAASRALPSRLAVAALVVALSLLVPTAISAARPPDRPPGNVNVQLLAINDFHGNLKPPTGSSGSRRHAPSPAASSTSPPRSRTLEARPTRTGPSRSRPVTSSVPARCSSAAFHDEPTIEAMNALGLDISAVGNHEFDEGVDELLRMQNGGCHPVDGCQDGDGFAGAKFQYLAANVVYKSHGQADLPGLSRSTISSGVKVGFIGLTLEGTPEHRQCQRHHRPSTSSMRPRRSMPRPLQLKANGVHTIVVLLHEGGAQRPRSARATINTCTGMSGAIVPIVANSTRGRHGRSAATPTTPTTACSRTRAACRSRSPAPPSFGRLVTDIDMKINTCDATSPRRSPSTTSHRHPRCRPRSGRDDADHEVQHGHRADRQRDRRQDHRRTSPNRTIPRANRPSATSSSTPSSPTPRRPAARSRS